MHFSFQQIQHLWSQFVEYQLNYYPPYCELEKIVNLTTEACDPLDGRVDGVVSRTDLCKLHFNLNSTIGESYSCSETAEIPNFMPYIPAQNGTVTTKGVGRFSMVHTTTWAAVFTCLINLLLNSKTQSHHTMRQPENMARTSLRNPPNGSGSGRTKPFDQCLRPLQLRGSHP